MNVSLRVAILVCLCACQPPKPTPQEPEVVEADCSLAFDQALLHGGQGARVRIPFTAGVDVKNVRIEQLMTLSDSVEGNEVRATLPYGVEAATLVLASDCDGTTKLTNLDFTVSAPTWKRAGEWTTTGPIAREYFSMWLDPNDGNKLLVHGGFVYVPRQFTPNDELWEFDITAKTWAQRTQSGAKPTVAAGRIALASDGKSALYFGGVDVAGMSTPYVLKRIDLETNVWTDEPIATGGRGEYQPTFFFDAKRNRHLSICGLNLNVGPHCDVRQLINGAWSTVATAGTPPTGRNGHAWVYDAQTDRIVLFGGDFDGATRGDTWALDLSTDVPTWRLLFEAWGGLEARRNMAYALDTKNHRLIIWGGTRDGASAVPGIQALDLTPGLEQWADFTATGDVPPSRASAGAVYDAANNRLLMGFGNTSSGQYADLWELSL